jgi:hypothetical protein
LRGCHEILQTIGKSWNYGDKSRYEPREQNAAPDDKETHAWSWKTMTVAALTAHRLCDRKYTLNAASSIAGVRGIWDTGTLDDLSSLFRIAADLCDCKQMIYDL